MKSFVTFVLGAISAVVVMQVFAAQPSAAGTRPAATSAASAIAPSPVAAPAASASQASASAASLRMDQPDSAAADPAKAADLAKAVGPAKAAGESAESIPVVTVNGKPIMLRAVEDALLRKEGVEHLQKWFSSRLEHADWAKLSDDETIIAVAGATISRRQIAVALLKEGAGKVREDLIGVELVEQALARSGIGLGANEFALEFTRMAERFEDDLVKKNKPRVAFEQYLAQVEKQTKEEFMAQPGFRVLAGIHALVEKQARSEWTDADLRPWFEARRAVYDQTEAVELHSIYVPYITEKDTDKNDIVTPDEKERLMNLMMIWHSAIAANEKEFERKWEGFSKAWDPNTTDGGRIGWVTRDGKRGPVDARIIPVEVMAQAWAVMDGFPRLLRPIPSVHGIDLIKVTGRRPAQAADFAGIRDRVLADRLALELTPRTDAMVRDLRRAANIAYASLPEAIRRREGVKP